MEDCPIDDFVRLTKDAVPTDWLKQCGISTTENSHSKTLALGMFLHVVTSLTCFILYHLYTVYYLSVNMQCFLYIKHDKKVVITCLCCIMII